MIGRYISYLKYVVRHKAFVMWAGMKYFPSMRMFWRLLVHDLSKFYPSEFIAYACCFYKPDGSKQYDETDAFNMAWCHHQKRNKHHHQYWVLRMDSGTVVAMEMDEIYALEMIADWMGAGKAITGNWGNIHAWYSTAKDNMVLHPATQKMVEDHLIMILMESDGCQLLP